MSTLLGQSRAKSSFEAVWTRTQGFPRTDLHYGSRGERLIKTGGGGRKSSFSFRADESSRVGENSTERENFSWTEDEGKMGLFLIRSEAPPE